VIVLACCSQRIHSSPPLLEAARALACILSIWLAVCWGAFQ
jgi:hypothetical protein